jgi:CRISPR system Cascade subunit CasB
MRQKCEEKYEPRPDPKINAVRFIEYLECLADLDKTPGEQGSRQTKPDRGALAQIRRTLGKKPDQAIAAFPYVVRWTEGLNNDWHEECYYLVAALYATRYQALGRSLHHQKDLKNYQRNLGASFLELDKEQRKESQTDERSRSLERRFTNLLMSRKEDLPERLRHAISLLASKEIPIDWLQLLLDLLSWDQRQIAYASRPQQSAQRRWAKAFWRIDKGAGGADSTEPADEISSNDNDNNSDTEDDEL